MTSHFNHVQPMYLKKLSTLYFQRTDCHSVSIINVVVVVTPCDTARLTTTQLSKNSLLSNTLVSIGIISIIDNPKEKISLADQQPRKRIGG